MGKRELFWTHFGINYCWRWKLVKGTNIFEHQIDDHDKQEILYRSHKVLKTYVRHEEEHQGSNYAKKLDGSRPHKDLETDKI